MSRFFQANPVAWPVLLTVIFCTVMAVFGVTNRPLFPVDETRYVSVAWEMFSRNDWLLPTLNLEAYHHKPPVLFWIIMTLWSVFGVSQGIAIATPYVIAGLACLMGIRMTRIMVPDNPRLPMLSAALILGSLIFVLYGNLIMFDMLLSIFVTLGITSIWQFARTGRWLYIALFGVAIGLGVLSKGPVVLLHLLFPVLLVRLWLPAADRVVKPAKWIGAFIAGILLGAAIALSWAIPAAIAGGPEFTEKIFWGQTAGRVANAFDHQRPFWWYLPILPLFGLPWLLHGGLWQGFKELKSTGTHRTLLRFLSCWLIPVFISFSLISGKQIHYLLPLIPGLALVFALALDQIRDRVTLKQAFPAVIICALLALSPAIGNVFADQIEALSPESVHLSDTLGMMSVPVSVACGMLILALGATQLRRGLIVQVTVISVSMLIFVSCFLVEAGRGYFKNFDLMPIASVAAQFPKTPLAFVRNYHGEWSFLARLDRPVKQIDVGDMAAWFKENPDGLMFIRTSRPEEFAAYDVIFSMPYKMGNTYALIVPKGRAKNFPYIVPE